MTTYNTEDINHINYKKSLIYVMFLQYIIIPFFFIAGLFSLIILILLFIIFFSNLIVEVNDDKFKFLSLIILPFMFFSIPGVTMKNIYNKTSIEKFSYEDVWNIHALCIISVFTFGISVFLQLK